MKIKNRFPLEINHLHTAQEQPGLSLEIIPLQAEKQ